MTIKMFMYPLGKEVDSFYMFIKEGVNNNYKMLPCQYIGWIKDLAIVIEMPRVNHSTGARLYQMEPGQKVQAKLHSGKNEYVFQSFVMCVNNNPIPHLHIKHPSKVKVVVLRTSDRKRAYIASTAKVDDKIFSIVILDLSANGAAILTDVRLETNSEAVLIVSFPINGRTQSLEIPFIVRNNKNESGKIRYGVEFKNLSLKDTIFLQSFIYTL